MAICLEQLPKSFEGEAVFFASKDEFKKMENYLEENYILEKSLHEDGYILKIRERENA